MIHDLVGLLLSPVLVYQGKKVRRTIPVLPEPHGPRSGRVGTGTPLHILFVGDSAMAGVGAGSQEETLYMQVVNDLARTRKITWETIARTGARTDHLIRRLGRMDASSFDVAVISLGVNDITGGIPVSLWIRRQKELIDLLRHRFGVRTIVLSGMPPVHGFPALPQPLRWVLGQKARTYTRALRTLARDENHPFVTIDFTMDVGLMASDGFHPGPGIYRLWAQRIVDLIKARTAIR